MRLDSSMFELWAELGQYKEAYDRTELDLECDLTDLERQLFAKKKKLLEKLGKAQVEIIRQIEFYKEANK